MLETWRTIPTKRLLAAVFALALVALPGPPAHADLEADHELTYRADVDNGYLHVGSSFVVTNKTPDRREGNIITQFFYDRIALYVPENLENFSAISGGSSLDYSLDPPEEDVGEGLQVATVRFGRRLFYNQSLELAVAYDIPGDPPRTESAFRVNPSYVSFPVFAFGDPGRVTVNIVVPKSFDVETYGDEPTSRNETDVDQIVTFSDIEGVEEFFVWVAGWDDEALSSRTVDLGGFEVIVRSWPEDDVWQTDVAEIVETGLPDLEQLIGLPWVLEDELTITESLEVTLAGYGGWYMEDLSSVHLSEWPDPQLVLHELAHVWFDGDMFEERWINEGLADEFATLAAARAELANETDLRYDIAPDPGSGTHLQEWVLPEEALGPDASEEDVAAYEEYGYQASWWVVQEIVDEIGPDAMTKALRWAAEGDIAYPGEPEPEMLARPGDWRLFLDLVEEVGGSKAATQLFQDFVVSESLDERTEAREAYADLEARAGSWGQPLYVRIALAEWEFDEAMLRMAAAGEILETRDQINTNLTTLGIDMGPELEELYETASVDLTETDEYGDAYLASSTDVVEAKESRDTERNLLMTVGLLGDDVDLEYQESLDALENTEFEKASVEATEVILLLDEAESTGTTRLIWTGSVLLILVGGGIALALSRRRRRHRNTPSPSTPGTV